MVTIIATRVFDLIDKNNEEIQKTNQEQKKQQIQYLKDGYYNFTIIFINLL